MNAVPHVRFPDSLINEFARRRCVLFLGAGISATAVANDATHPPDWQTFISGALEIVPSKKLRNEAKRYLALNNNTLALQVILNSSDRSDYISYVEKCFNNPKYRPSEVHKTILELDAKIVITTNFDPIYDNYCRNFSKKGFKIISYDNESLSDTLRSDASIIIKAHGSIDNTQKMIFSKAEYHKAKKNYWKFYELLKAIFMTNTILFLGCGMTDPDLLSILEEVKITATPQKPHYLLTKSGQSESVKKDLFDSYNIETLSYGNSYEQFLPVLKLFLERVREKRASLGVNW